MKTMIKTPNVKAGCFRLSVIVIMIFLPLFSFPQEVIRLNNGNEYDAKIISMTKESVRFRLLSDTTEIREVRTNTIVTIIGNGPSSKTKKIRTFLDSIRFDEINRSLGAASTMSIITFIYQEAAFALAMPLQSGNGTDAGGAGALFLGVGGIGMATNISILTSKAFRRVKAWDYDQQDLEFKNKLYRKLTWAKTLSIVQNLMPVAGIIASGISNNFDGNFINPFLICYGIGAIMLIPELLIIESARHDVREYQRSLSLGSSQNGFGLVIKL